jgi:hypothetical protein
MEGFLREGLERYPDAREAVETFEREVQDRLLRLLEEKDDWQNFNPKRGQRGRGKALASGAWSGAGGRTIYAYQNSEQESDGWIDLKLWWRSPRARDKVLICCGRWDLGYRMRQVDLADPKAPVVCGPIDQNKALLYTVLEANADFHEIGRLLLDEMDRALAKPAPTW